MRFLRLLSFIFLFCIDVRVKAEEVSACWSRHYPCVVQSKSEKTVVQSKQFVLSLSPASLVEQRAADRIELVEGRFYVDTSKGSHFQTPYAKVWCAGSCKALFEREMTTFAVKNLGGQWHLQRNGEAQTYSLPEGMQLRLGEVSTDGMALMEFPQSLPWDETVREWSALFPGPLASFKAELVRFRPVWREAVEAVSVMHQQAANRTIAAYQKEQDEERARNQAKAHEDAELRALFREKNP